jgi:hypothetical protein
MARYVSLACLSLIVLDVPFSASQHSKKIVSYEQAMSPIGQSLSD